MSETKKFGECQIGTVVRHHDKIMIVRAEWQIDCAPSLEVEVLADSLSALVERAEQAESAAEWATSMARDELLEQIRPHLTDEQFRVTLQAFTLGLIASLSDKRATPTRCHDCGMLYDSSRYFDAAVPDEIWAQISPTEDEGGILCIGCMAARLEGLGIRCPVFIGSGPFANHGDNPEVAIWRERAIGRQEELDVAKTDLEAAYALSNYADRLVAEITAERDAARAQVAALQQAGVDCLNAVISDQKFMEILGQVDTSEFISALTARAKAEAVEECLKTIPEAIYEATRQEAADSERPIVPEPWQGRDEKFRTQFTDAILKITAPGYVTTPKAEHDNWMRAYEEMGWTYGEKRDPVAKTHPDMVPFADLPKAEREKDAIFLACCAVARALRALVPAPSAPAPEATKGGDA